MITNGVSVAKWELSGLSTDIKPTDGVPNGSTFEEIDTGNKYIFDGENLVWYARTSSGNSPYSLPVATEATLGGIKESDTIVVDEDGTAHAVAAEISEESFATDSEVEAVIDDVFGDESP